jgi:hypothetical protein
MNGDGFMTIVTGKADELAKPSTDVDFDFLEDWTQCLRTTIIKPKEFPKALWIENKSG